MKYFEPVTAWPWAFWSEHQKCGCSPGRLIKLEGGRRSLICLPPSFIGRGCLQEGMKLQQRGRAVVLQEVQHVLRCYDLSWCFVMEAVFIIISELSSCYGFIVGWIKQLSDECLSSFRWDPRGSWLLQSPVYSISATITPEYSKKVSVLSTGFRGRGKRYWTRLLCRERAQLPGSVSG